MADKTTTGGLSLCSALTLLFIGLKLCKVIDWSWWLVLSPLWVPWAIVGIIGGGIMIYAVLYHIAQRSKK